MANPTSLAYYNAELGKSDPYQLDLFYTITAATTVMTPAPYNTASLTTSFNATSLITTQEQIDNFLGTTSEFLVTQFNTAALISSAQAAGIIVNMDGQCRAVVGGTVAAYAADTGLPVTTTTSNFLIPTALSTSGIVNRISSGFSPTINDSGNIGIQVNLGATVVAANSYLHLRIFWLPR